MANVSGVSIDVDLDIGEATSKIAALKAELKSLGENINIDVDVDRDKFDQIKKDIKDSDLNLGVGVESDGLDDLKKDLNDATESATGGTSHKKSDSEVGMPDSLREASSSRPGRLTQSEILDVVDRRESDLDISKTEKRPLIESIKPDFDNLDFSDRRISSDVGSDSGSDGPRFRRKPAPLFDGPADIGGGSGGKFFNPRGVGDDSNDKGLSGIGGKLKKIIPTNMRMWYSVLALMMPLLIAMAGALAGVASAMIGAAGAGATLIGLGLVGHGEDMGEAFANAKKEAKELGTAIFEVMQNPAKKFAPIQAEIFDMIPGEMSGLAESLEGITVFEELIKGSIKGVIGWLGALVDMFVANEEAISDVTGTFGNVIGHGIIDFFRYFIQEGQKSQNSLILFGSALKTILKIIYNLSKGVSAVLAGFQPLLNVILLISKVLNNKFVMSLVAGLAVMITTIKVSMILAGVIATLSGIMGGGMVSGIIKGIVALQAYIAKLLVLQGVAAETAMAVSAATLGLGLLAGGAAAIYTKKKLSSDIGDVSHGDAFGGGAGGGRQTVINNNEINISGDADRKSREKMFDAFDERKNQNDSMSMGG